MIPGEDLPRRIRAASETVAKATSVFQESGLTLGIAVAHLQQLINEQAESDAMHIANVAITRASGR